MTEQPQQMSKQKMDEGNRKLQRCCQELVSISGEYNFNEAEVSFEVTRQLGNARVKRFQAMQQIDKVNIERVAQELAKKKAEEAEETPRQEIVGIDEEE